MALTITDRYKDLEELYPQALQVRTGDKALESATVQCHSGPTLIGSIHDVKHGCRDGGPGSERLLFCCVSCQNWIQSDAVEQTDTDVRRVVEALCLSAADDVVKILGSFVFRVSLQGKGGIYPSMIVTF